MESSFSLWNHIETFLAVAVGYHLECQTKIAADNILIFYFYLLQKIRLDISYESSVSYLFVVILET